MSDEKTYFDSDGDERTLYGMVRDEREWACNRIREGEKAIARVAELEGERDGYANTIRVGDESRIQLGKDLTGQIARVAELEDSLQGIMNICKALKGGTYQGDHRNRKEGCMTPYDEAKAAGLTELDRWSGGIAHHPKSVQLMEFLAEHDLKDYQDYFCWKKGGDGDNGETLMYQMDAFFEITCKESTE